MTKSFSDTFPVFRNSKEHDDSSIYSVFFTSKNTFWLFYFHRGIGFQRDLLRVQTVQ